MPNLAKLTPEEDKVWTQNFEWYVEEGWTDDEADQNAWTDLVQVFPRLKDFDGAEPDVDEAGAGIDSLNLAEEATGEEAENIAEGMAQEDAKEEAHQFAPGDTVSLGDQQGTVISVSGNNVKVDTGSKVVNWHATKITKV